MRYSACTPDELRWFVRDRRLTIGSPGRMASQPSHEDYTDALLRADAHPLMPFKFFSLPAELRNRVYELLLDNGSLFTAHPIILRTCRQVCCEASSICYSTNTFTVSKAPSHVQVSGRRIGHHSLLHGAAGFAFEVARSVAEGSALENRVYSGVAIEAFGWYHLHWIPFVRTNILGERQAPARSCSP